MKTTFSLVPEIKLHTQLPLNNTLFGERSLKYQLLLKRISGCISCEFLGLNSAGTVAALCSSSNETLQEVFHLTEHHLPGSKSGGFCLDFAAENPVAC